MLRGCQFKLQEMATSIALAPVGVDGGDSSSDMVVVALRWAAMIMGASMRSPRSYNLLQLG